MGESGISVLFGVEGMREKITPSMAIYSICPPIWGGSLGCYQGNGYPILGWVNVF